MSKVRFELNYEGVGELLKSPEMQAVLNEYAMSRAESSDSVEVKVMPTRAVAFLNGSNENNRLLKRVKK